MTENKDLKEIYNSQELDFHSGFEESLMLANMLPWKGKRVLEIGCGQGHLASILTYAGARVRGIDYAEEEIRVGLQRYPTLDLECLDYKEVTDRYDAIILQGVLEHLDDPWLDLEEIILTNLKDFGHVVLSVPNWINPRGYVYHTCRLLGAKMSLTDLHWFLPGDFEKFCKKHNHTVELMRSCDFSWSTGEEMVTDLKDRIPKAFRDAGPPYMMPVSLRDIEKKAQEIASWTLEMARYEPDVMYRPLSGANLGVLIKK